MFPHKKKQHGNSPNHKKTRAFFDFSIVKVKDRFFAQRGALKFFLPLKHRMGFLYGNELPKYQTHKGHRSLFVVCSNGQSC
jgi:hypothetical protein